VTRVTVAEGYQVVVDSTAYLAAESLEVDDDQADRWCAAGWVTVAAEKPRTPRPRSSG